jgi:hypothetical protein
MACRFALGEIEEARAWPISTAPKRPGFRCANTSTTARSSRLRPALLIVDAMRGPGLPETPEEAAMLCKIGEVEIWRILDWHGLFLTPEALFPNAPEDVARIIEDLAPGSVDAARGG